MITRCFMLIFNAIAAARRDNRMMSLSVAIRFCLGRFLSLQSIFILYVYIFIHKH